MPMSLLFTFSFYATEFYAVSGFALLEEDIHQHYFSAMDFMKLIRKLRRKKWKTTLNINGTSITEAINNLGQIIFNVLRKVGWIFNQRLNKFLYICQPGRIRLSPSLDHSYTDTHKHSLAHRQCWAYEQYRNVPYYYAYAH